MKENLKSGLKLVIVTLIGLIILFILTNLSIFTINNILATLGPENPGVFPGPSGIGLAYFTFTMAAIYMFSTWAISFIAGFWLTRWNKEPGSSAWLSLVSGFIIGAIGPLLIFMSRSIEALRPYIAFLSFLYFADALTIRLILTPIGVLLYGFVSALMGLLGYFLAGRKYRRLAPG